MPHHARSSFIWLCCLTASSQASITQATAQTPGGYAQSACFPSNLPGLLPGGDLGIYASQDFHEQPFAGGGSASVSSAYTNGATITNNAGATAELGRIRMASYASFPGNASFSGGMSNACWKDTFTVSHPSLNGQTGYLLFELRARGTLTATGGGGSASLLTTAYRNNVELLVNPYFSRANADAISSDRQRAQWAASSFGTTVHRAIDGTVTMAVPITFGQQFTLAVCARSASGQRSSGSSTAISTSTMDFSGIGVTWQGVSGVLNSAGGAVSGASISSGSGTDWSPPVMVCDPIDFNGDGLFPDTADIDDFLTVFSGGPCGTGTCGDIDFNNDGLFPDTSDIDSFLSVFSGGPCQ